MQMNPTRWWLASGLTLVLVLLAWQFQPLAWSPVLEDEPDTAVRATAQAQPASDAPSTAPRSRLVTGDGQAALAAIPAAREPEPQAMPRGDFVAMRDELERLAQEGHAGAALRLALAPAFCDWLASADGDVEQLAERLVEMGSFLNGEMQHLGFSAPFEIIAMAVIHAAERNQALCEGVTHELTQAVDADAQRQVPQLLGWAERAAQGGELAAMLAYPSLALRDVSDPYEVVMHAERLLERRERAAFWVRRALQLGHPEALYAHAFAHWRGWPLPRDPLRAYAYLLAYEQSGHRGVEHPEVLDYLHQRLAQPLSAAQRRQARDLAERLADCCR